MDTKLLSTDRPVAIYYALKSEISSFTKIGIGKCAVALSGTGWKFINTTIGTIDLQEKSSKTKAGTTYSTELNSICPGHDDSTPGDFITINGVPVIIRIDYRNGIQKIIGNALVCPILFFTQISNTTTSRKLQLSFNSSSPNLLLS